MKLILPSEFENLRVNDEHGYEVDNNSGREILKIYMGEKLIAKRKTMDNGMRTKKQYFGVKGYEQYLTKED